MPGTSFSKKILNFLARNITENNTANILIALSAAGWLASSVAQTVGIYKNENYTKEQKSFMLPQEIADAMVNICSFLAVTLSLKKFASELVRTGKLATSKISNFIRNDLTSNKRGEFDFDVTKLNGFSEYEQDYNNLKMVAETVAATVGGVLSSNIITPILRNKIAAHRQEKVMKTLSKYDKITVSPQWIKPVENGKIHTAHHTFEDFRNNALRI